ncbi:MAG: hypothetical protein WC149_02500 [Arcobacteraceae bacterium]
MQLKYAGPKPVISEHGITFKDGKEDKYVYLMIAIQILQAIDHDTAINSHYEYNTSTKRLSDEEMQNIVLSYHPNLDAEIHKEINGYLVHLDNEIQDVKKSPIFSPIEKEAYIGNLKIMREYKIQRAKNKIFYMHAINTIVEVIKQRKIKKISTPFYEKFWHTLQTIQGHLALSKRGLQSDVKVVTNEDRLYAILTIENNF